MSTSWQVSRTEDFNWQYHRLKQLLRNVSINAKKTRLILEEFETGVNDSVEDLKYVSEDQFKIDAPKVEDKLLEAIKLEKKIQQLLEQNMLLQTDLRCQSSVNTHSYRSSYTATPAGVYTPAHTPYTGISSYVDRGSNIDFFEKTPDRMASFPQNFSNIFNSTYSLQTPLSMVHNEKGTEVQNAEDKQSLNSMSIPKCNLIFSENDTSPYNTEYATPKLGHNVTVELSSVTIESVENSSDNVNKNESNDAYIEIPEEVFNSPVSIPGYIPVCIDNSHEYESTNNTAISDEFFTPRSNISQENTNVSVTNKEMVIDIDTTDFHSNDVQEDFNASELKIMNQADHTLSAKRKRVSTCNTPIKCDESKHDNVNASENVNVTNTTHDRARDTLYNTSLDDGLSTYHVEFESSDQKMTQKDDILKNSQVVIDNVKFPQKPEYGNEFEQTASYERPFVQMKETETVLTLQKSLKQLSSKDCQDLTNITEANTSFNSNTADIRHQEVLVETCCVQDNIVHSTESLKQIADSYSLITDTEIKPECTTIHKETVINCENLIYDITYVPQTVPPLEQYTNVYVTHFEAPNQVWVQLEDCGIEKFQYDLNCAVSQHSEPVPEELISLNTLVIAPYGDSNEFYRAQVNSIIKGNEEPCVKVNFLDYGNSETVKISSLVMMSESVMNVPCIAIPCILEKVNGADLSSWSSFDLLFSQLVNNTPFYAYIKHHENEPLKRTHEYEENEVSGLQPRYVITLSEVLVNEAMKPNMESSIADSANEAELDLQNGISSNSSTSYLSYHGEDKEVSLNEEESINQPKIVNTSEDCEISQQKSDTVDHMDEVTECAKNPESDISKNVICLQKITTNEISNNEEFKGSSEINAEDNVQTNDSATENEKTYNALKVLCSTEMIDNKAADKWQTRRQTRKCVTTSNFNLAKKSEYKKDSRSRMVSESIKEPETNDSTYCGKWSSLITDSAEYTLNAAGKVVNFSSNESCIVKPGNSNTQIYNSIMQKSCRKRQMSGSGSAYQNTLRNILSGKAFDTQSDKQSLVDKRIRRKSVERETARNKQQQDNISNEDKSTHLCLPHPDGKKFPISNSSGSDSECFLPVEVLPVVKLEKQTVPLGAEEQIQVMVSHVDTPNSFFLHLINSETSCIERFHENMTEHYKNDCDDLNVETLPIGSFWAVRWKDNSWYRAQVLASLPRKEKKEELHVKVRFVDHGDSDDVSIKDVRVLSETFTLLPILALPCSLAQVSPLNEWEEIPWTQETIEGFVNLVGEFSSILKANFISYSLNAHFDVVLENEFGVINELMVKKGFAKSFNLERIGKDFFPGFLDEDVDSMTNNVSNSPAVDGLSNQLKLNLKQTSKFHSLKTTSAMQILKCAYKGGPVSIKLLKMSNQNMPVLPLNTELSLVPFEKSDADLDKIVPANNINDVKCERGFIRKFCSTYGFIEHFGFQNSLFFHYSEFYGDIDFVDIGDLVEFEICFDELRFKPMAINVVKLMSHQERLVGYVNEEILKESCDRKQCITYIDGERFLYIPFDKDDVEGYVLLKPWDKVSFTINFNKCSGELTATHLSLEGMTESSENANISDSFMDSQPQDIRWDPLTESYSNGYSFQNDECAETVITGRKNSDLARLCKFYRVDGKCPRGVTCRYQHELLNQAHTVEKEAVFIDLLEDPHFPKEKAVVMMVVTHVESPGMFYCYLPNGVADLRHGNAKDSGIGLSNSYGGLSGLLKLMTDHYRHSLPTPNRTLPAVGELRAAPLLIDGEVDWWRVRVLKIKENERDQLEVEVFFLDYGEVSWVKEMELRPLDDQFLHVPAQALECWLYDVPIPQTGWTTAAKEHFIDLTKEKQLVGHILHCDESSQRLGVKLYDTTGDNEININEVMND